MAQYYYTDGKERYGPFTIEQLRERNITPETLVWKEGMADWLPAKQVSELESLSLPDQDFTPPIVPSYTSPPTVSPAPKNWLVESILVTIFCCPWVFGILGIINAAKVESLWNTGQHDAAIKASQDAAKWVKIGFFVGIALYGVYILLMIFGVVASIGLGEGFPQ